MRTAIIIDGLVAHHHNGYVVATSNMMEEEALTKVICSWKRKNKHSRLLSFKCTRRLVSSHTCVSPVRSRVLDLLMIAAYRMRKKEIYMIFSAQRAFSLFTILPTPK